MQDVPALIWAFEQKPSNFQSKASPSKRVSVVPTLELSVHKLVSTGPSSVMDQRVELEGHGRGQGEL